MFIENEIPTDCEIAVYFMEYFQLSVLLGFSRGSQKYWMDEERKKACELLRRSEYERFSKTCLASIFETLRKINSIDRNHVMWNQTNKRPIVGRFGDYYHSYCDSKFTETDLFASIGLQLHGGSNYFGQDEWKQLYEMKSYPPEWVLASGILFDLNIGKSEVPLASLLNDLSIKREAQIELSNLENSDNGYLKKWARNVLQKL
jgi:hypothetical protein